MIMKSGFGAKPEIRETNEGSGFNNNRVWDFWRSKSGSGVLTVDKTRIMG